jgi:hypothetical protein
VPSAIPISVILARHVPPELVDDRDQEQDRDDEQHRVVRGGRDDLDVARLHDGEGAGRHREPEHAETEPPRALPRVRPPGAREDHDRGDEARDRDDRRGQPVGPADLGEREDVGEADAGAREQ